MGAKIILVLFFVVVLGAVIYVFHTGLVGKAEQQFTSLLHPGSSTTTGGFFIRSNGNDYPYPSAGNVTQVGPSGSSTAAVTTTTIPNSSNTIYLTSVPIGLTVNQLSPYFQEVRFEGISPGSPYSYGQIILADALEGSSTIDVTGWQIKSNHGGEYIPQAVNLYDPSGLTIPTDIRLLYGQDVYLYSSPGPFNLRLNECTGYIGVSNHLTPALPLTCPEINQSAISSFSGACQNFIESLGTCQSPDLNNPQIPRNDYTCRQFIEDNFNYGACFTAHKSDPDFLSNQWWIWTGSSPVDEYHDNVQLLDRNGLVVDTYSY